MISRKYQPDVTIAMGLALLYFFLYAHFGLRLAQGIYFDYLNLAFDFDPPYFIDFLVGTFPCCFGRLPACSWWLGSNRKRLQRW